MERGKTSLLFGVTGFIGCHLSRYLLGKGHQVVGTYFHRRPPKHIFDKRIILVRCDITEPANIKRVVHRFLPDHIYYLSAQSSVRDAWLKPIETLQINFLGGVHLLETLRRTGSKAKVLIFSSGTTYGDSHVSGRGLDEEACLKPRDPYSVSKAGIDFFARLYARVFNLRVSVVRLANFTGRGQSTNFSISNFAAQIARMEARGHGGILYVGNLMAKRDYLDIRDGITALYLAMKDGRTGAAYNISSGVSRTLKDVLDNLIQLSKLKGRQIEIRKTKALMPKDEIVEIRLNSRKFRSLTKWSPRIPLRETLSDILDEWRQKVREVS